MLATTAQKMARFIIAARRIRRGRSALSRHRTVSSISNPVQDYRSVDDSVRAGNQDGNEGGQRTEKKRRRRLRNDMR
ncbi:hypothetical protein V1294_006251 [Bradyrhizobium sp. AZCC 1678]|uniref:hypothetical protein n=1 Tax=Bradyrhizobium sp. AZCC 1678 TaxID=3117030 RepID=UPI002FF274C5